jgi:hypothetical protein
MSVCNLPWWLNKNQGSYIMTVGELKKLLTNVPDNVELAAYVSIQTARHLDGIAEYEDILDAFYNQDDPEMPYFHLGIQVQGIVK